MSKGFASQEKLGEQRHVTVVPTGSTKHALDVTPKAIFPTNLVPFTPVSATYQVGVIVSGLPVTRQLIEITAHGGKEGDVLRFDTGPLVNIEASVLSVVDANTLEISLRVSNADAVASTCLVMRHITLTLDANGSLVTSSGPIQYILDAAAEEAEEDTATPANNRGLPTQTFFDVDGVQTPIMRDTAAEANTAALPTMLYYLKDGIMIPANKNTAVAGSSDAIPVEIIGADGMVINVTTGDIGVQLNSNPAVGTADSVLVGTVGFNRYLTINNSNEVQTRDDDLNTATGEIANGKIIDPNASANLIENGKGILDRIIALLVKFPSTIGRKADSDSLSIALSTEDKAVLDGIASSTADLDTTEDYYKRDFTGSPLTTAASWVTLRTLTASIKRVSITNNSGNELLIRNATTLKQIVVGQGAVFSNALLGIATDVIEVSALGADAVDGIIYVNFEG